MCGGFASIRDPVEAIASLAGNYFLPGSSLLSDQLVSKGAQGDLSSPLGELAQIGTGAAGGGAFGAGLQSSGGALEQSLLNSALSGAGSSLTSAGNSIGSLLGDSSLGTDVGSGISNIGTSVGNAFNGATDSIGNLLNGSSANAATGEAVAPDFASGLANSAASPSATGSAAINASSLPGASTGLGSQAGGATGGGFSLGGATDSLGPSASGEGTSLLTDPTAIGANPVGADFQNGLLNPNASDATGSNVGGFSIPGVSPVSTLSTGGSMPPQSSIASLLGGNSGTSALGGILRSGIMGALNNPNNKGYDAQMAAGQNIQNLYNPFVQTGTTANTTLANLLGENGTDAGAQAAAQANFANTPGYQFAEQQGENAINANAAATGQTLSGNNQQAIQNYGTGLANQTYNQYVNNLQNQVGTGVSAAGGVASGLLGSANAQAGKSGAAANNQNAVVGGVANSLFPQSSLAQLLKMFSGGNQANAY